MTEIWNLSAVCRCCHSDGHFKSLSRTYVVKNDVEIYSSMLRDTFGIIIDPPAEDISYSICDLCIDALRRATQFKKQVLICESKFEEYCKNEESQQIHDDVKIELDSVHDDSDREDFYNPDYKDTDDKKVEVLLEVKDEVKDDINKGIKDIKREDETVQKIEISIEAKKSITLKPKNSKDDGTKAIRNRETEVSDSSVIESKNGYSCKFCGKTYKHLKTVRLHISSTHGELYKCKICDMGFKTIKERSLHMATHKQAGLTCSYCGKKFPLRKKYNFKLHLNSHTKESIFECDYCNKQFLHRRSLLNHISSMHLGLPIRKVICDICGHTFNDVTNMRKHVQTVHEKLRLFKCQSCPRDFTAKKHLVVHERRTHTGERPFKCDECNLAFACAQELKKHKMVHSGKKLAYTCKLCRLEFNSRGALAKHTRTHAGSKPLICHICSRDFSCKYSLRRHIMYHSGEKRFQCGICLKKFPEKQSLRRHNERFHSGKVVEKKQCHLCKRQVNDLDKHLAVHNNKPHSCEYCSKRYSFRNALNRHIANIHFGRKAHACDLCDHKYVNLKTLLNHKLKVHKIETKVEKETIGLDDYVTTYLADVNKRADVKMDGSS